MLLSYSRSLVAFEMKEEWEITRLDDISLKAKPRFMVRKVQLVFLSPIFE